MIVNHINGYFEWIKEKYRYFPLFGFSNRLLENYIYNKNGGCWKNGICKTYHVGEWKNRYHEIIHEGYWENDEPEKRKNILHTHCH